MADESRRGFFRSLVAGGATVTSTLSGKPLKHRKPDKQPNEGIYHGPMLIPADIAEIVRESPDLHQCESAPKPKPKGGTRRSRSLAARYADADCTWLFKCRIPDSRQMVGEVVRTPDGKYRVHCWSAATPATTYRDARRFMERAQEPEEPWGLMLEETT